MMTFEIKRGNAIKSIYAYLIISFLASSIIRVIVQSVCLSLNIDLTVTENVLTASSVINFIVYLVLFGALIFINKDELVTDIKTFFTHKPKLILIKILAGYGIFYVINAFSSILIQNIETYMNMFNSFFNKDLISSTADNQTQIEAILKSDGFIFMFLSAGLIGPITEELVFRKAFFNMCRTKEMGIILSSLCFGLIHVVSSFGTYDLFSTILMTIPYVVSGIAFGIIYIKNDCDIVIPTIVHILSNIISMLGIIFLL